MLKRWNLTAAQMSTQISQYMQTAQELYQDVFGISLVFDNSPTRYTTSADTCTGTATLAALNMDCTSTSHNPRCKDINTIWSDFRQAHPGNANLVPILWTGHYTWDSDNGQRNEIHNAGIYSYSHSIVLRDIGDDGSTTFSNSNRIKRTSCHELAHELGAPDSYCLDKNGSGENCPEHCWRHGGANAYDEICIMAELRDFSNYSNDELLCEHCKNDIINHLNAYH